MDFLQTAIDIAWRYWPHVAILAGLFALYRILWPFNPRTWAKVALGIVLSLIVQHKVLCVMGFTEYLEPELVKQNQSRYWACKGGPLGIGRNETACSVLNTLAKDGKGTEVAGLRQPPKLLTYLAESWQAQHPHQSQASQVPSLSPPSLLAATSNEGADCDFSLVPDRRTHMGYFNRFKHLVCNSARRHGLDPIFMAVQVNQESGFNPTALSSAKAGGIAQITPDTAKGWHVNPWDPQAALDAMAKHMVAYRNTYLRSGHSVADSHQLAAAAYNSGAHNVKKYGGIPPFSETRNYCKIVWGRTVLIWKRLAAKKSSKTA